MYKVIFYNFLLKISNDLFPHSKIISKHGNVFSIFYLLFIYYAKSTVNFTRFELNSILVLIFRQNNI